MIKRLENLEKKLVAVWSWLLLRKNTTPVHWLYGFFCAFLILEFGIVAGLVMMGIFAVMEYWNDKEEKARNKYYLPTGCADWWEAFLTFCIGYGVLALLHRLGIISIGWY